MTTDGLRQSLDPSNENAFLGWVRRHQRWLYAGVVIALLTQMAIVMITTAVEQSPTIDEPVYVGTAVVYLEEHSLRYNPEHPPLGKLIIAAGVAFTDPKITPGFAGHEWELGKHVVYEAGNDPDRLMLFARLPVILLTLLFGLVVFAFASDLAGRAGGLLALTLFTFSPDVIAHGSLATLDVPVAGFLLTSVWLVWRARRRPGLYLPLAGLALGAATATKVLSLVAVPVLIPLAVLSVWHARRARGLDLKSPALLIGRGVLAGTGMAVIAIAVVWVSYLVVDPSLHWETPSGMQPLHGMRTLVDWLPFPRPLRDGMRFQFELEDHVWHNFLFGRHYTGSLWYYGPAALLVKTPLGALAIWLAGAAVLLSVRRLRPAAPYVLVPTALLMATAMVIVRDNGVRYLAFAPMFLAVAAAAVLVVRRWWVKVAAVVVVAFAAVSSLMTFPYYLPYSNEAFGGPENTHRYLLDSNVDWGQDLGRLADRLKQDYAGEWTWLVYQGSGLPSYYGIDAADPLTVPADQVHGVLAVSDSAVLGAFADPMGGGGTGGGGATGDLDALIAGSTPIERVGHSMTIYRRP
ncbi:ArnT family glycosyltransferase [Amycolatopsis sp. NPDC102389]|uniref:ArnT family glycosyltransferase n=1 Tax=Amycolatopsis sp. NPDC102389 TaxID=3363941 RepID=UPI0037FD9AB1